jgi:hypothetical protein
VSDCVTQLKGDLILMLPLKRCIKGRHTLLAGKSYDNPKSRSSSKATKALCENSQIQPDGATLYVQFGHGCYILPSGRSCFLS